MVEFDSIINRLFENGVFKIEHWFSDNYETLLVGIATSTIYIEFSVMMI
jgi:hypothetical protein